MFQNRSWTSNKDQNRLKNMEVAIRPILKIFTIKSLKLKKITFMLRKNSNTCIRS